MRAWCSWHKEEHNVGEFGANRAAPGGLQNYCRAGMAAYQTTRKGRAANAKAHAKYDKTERGRATRAEYVRTSEGRAAIIKGRAQYLQRCASAVYLVRVCLTDGSDWLKVGSSNTAERRIGCIPFTTKEAYGVDVTNVEIVATIPFDKGDTEGRLAMEKKIIGTAKPAYGREYFHADTEEYFIDGFARNGGSKYVKANRHSRNIHK